MEMSNTLLGIFSAGGASDDCLDAGTAAKTEAARLAISKKTDSLRYRMGININVLKNLGKRVRSTVQTQM